MSSFRALNRLLSRNVPIRNLSTMEFFKKAIVNDKNQRNCVVKQAEQVVGYPTSFLSLRWILNDEIANVAIHLRKLIGTNHPLLLTARNLLFRNELPTWGLIVLLISKVVGLDEKFPELECDRIADILHSQRTLAEVTEMIKTSNLIHKGLIDIDPESIDASDLNFGNKLALLSGDYLLSLSFHELAKLNNFQVQEIMSSTLRDLAEAEFIGLRTFQNKPIPSKPLEVQKEIHFHPGNTMEPLQMAGVMGNMRAEWTLRNILGGASLLGKCCQSTLILGNQNTDVQSLGYSFGRNLALAWQASLERKLFLEDKCDLVAAPIMLHLEEDPTLYEEIEKGLIDKEINFDKIKKIVSSGNGLEKTLQLQNQFSHNAIEVLDQFSDSDSKTALINIIKSM